MSWQEVSRSWATTRPHCTAAKDRNRENTLWPTSSPERRIFWSLRTSLVVVSTSRMSLSSSITTWPRTSRITPIGSVERAELASTAKPFLSSPKTIRICSTTSSS
ncbi:UNVERIFIED_CONTAM: hypothetical protein GTU68_054565 [Idotea baltica]|nr:hypothetical protein [Idotea baltica]